LIQLIAELKGNVAEGYGLNRFKAVARIKQTWAEVELERYFAC